jgi:hypothetical protein
MNLQTNYSLKDGKLKVHFRNNYHAKKNFHGQRLNPIYTSNDLRQSPTITQRKNSQHVRSSSGRIRGHFRTEKMQTIRKEGFESTSIERCDE